MTMSVESEPQGRAPEGAPDRTIERVGVAILGFASLFAIVAAVFATSRVVLGCLLGGVIISANLLVLARVIRSAITGTGNPAAWLVLYLFKLVALFGGTYVLLGRGAVSTLGVVCGFAALLPAVVLVALRPSDR